MRVKEATVVRRMINYLNGLPQCRAHKVHGGAMKSSEPDIDACLDGRCIKIEAKAPGHAPLPGWQAIIQAWRDQGAPGQTLLHLEACARAGATEGQLRRLRAWHEAGAVTGVCNSVEELQAVLRNARLI